MSQNHIIRVPFVEAARLQVGIQVPEITEDIIRTYRGRLYDLMVTHDEIREAVVGGHFPEDKGVGLNGGYKRPSHKSDPVYSQIYGILGGIQDLEELIINKYNDGDVAALSSHASLAGSATLASYDVDDYEATYPDYGELGSSFPTYVLHPGDLKTILDKKLIKSNIVAAEKISRKLEPSAQTTVYGFHDVDISRKGEFEDAFGKMAEKLPQMLERRCEVIPSTVIPKNPFEPFEYHNYRLLYKDRYFPPGLIIRP